MYNFKTPVRGEPIDVTMLAKMGTYIANINEQLLSDRSAKSSVWGPIQSHIETPDLTIWTGKVYIGEVKGGVETDRILWNASFDIPFESIPIVTATPYCDTTGGGTKTSNSIWIHEVTSTGVKGRFRFNAIPARDEVIYALVIAIGKGQVV